jgi:hypothetical protein
MKAAPECLQSDVPPHLVQRGLGQVSLRTTGIYGDVGEPDERALAARMWVADDHNQDEI